MHICLSISRKNFVFSCHKMKVIAQIGQKEKLKIVLILWWHMRMVLQIYYLKVKQNVKSNFFRCKEQPVVDLSGVLWYFLEFPARQSSSAHLLSAYSIPPRSWPSSRDSGPTWGCSTLLSMPELGNLCLKLNYCPIGCLFQKVKTANGVNKCVNFRCHKFLPFHSHIDL